MDDAFSSLLGQERGSRRSIGDNLHKRRTERLGQNARSGDVDGAISVWRKSSDDDKRKILEKDIIEGVIQRACDELDLEMHWRGALARTNFWSANSNEIVYSPKGFITHLADNLIPLCGYGGSVYPAPRGCWEAPEVGKWMGCQKCSLIILENKDNEIDNKVIIASKEKRTFVPLSPERADYFFKTMAEEINLRSGNILDRSKDYLLCLLKEELGQTMQSDLDKTLALMQKQLVRTPQLALRRRLWTIYKVKDWKKIDDKDWQHSAELLLRQSPTTMWMALCLALSNNQKRSLPREMWRGLIGPACVRSSYFERQQAKKLRSVKSERSRAGW